LFLLYLFNGVSAINNILAHIKSKFVMSLDVDLPGLQATDLVLVLMEVY